MNISNLIFISSPLEQFEVTSLVGLNAPIFGYLNLTLTNLALYSFLVLFLSNFLILSIYTCLFLLVII